VTNHAICVTEDLVGFLIVDIADIVERDEELEWVFRVDLPYTALNLFLDLGFPLLSVAGEPKELVLVSPKDRFVLFRAHAREDMVNYAISVSSVW